MKKWIYTLSLMGALAVGANADVTKDPLTNADKDTEGCYLIGSAGQLLGFAEIVNGIPNENVNEESPNEYTQAPQPGACAKLTRNISFLDGTLLNADLTGFNGDKAPDANNWTPMENFSGKFYGQGYTISGVFYTGTLAGLFANIQGDALIDNLHIEDSYFASDNSVGAFVANVSDGNPTLNRCFFKGSIQSISSSVANAHLGGLVGDISSGNITIRNSGKEGYVGWPNKSYCGGIIGTMQEGSTATLDNIYSMGFVGTKLQNGIIGKYLGSITRKKNLICQGTGASCYPQNQTEDDMKNLFGEGLSQDIEQKGFIGVKIQYGTHPETGRKIVIAHITENDGDDVLQELVIPEDFPADSVDFDRPFRGTSNDPNIGKSSTVMIPFDIAAANVKNYNGDNVLLGSVESISCKNGEVKECEANAANAQSQISAHTPYLVSAFPINQDVDPIGDIPIGQTIHFHGPVVLKKIDKATNPTGEYKVSIPETNWTLVGTYKTLITTSKDDASAESDYEKISKLGKIFGFVGTAGVSDGEGDNKHDFNLGEFARAGHNVRTREMRSYLIYTPPTTGPFAAPAYKGMQRAAALSSEGEVELPSSIPVTFESRPIIPVQAFVDTTVKPTTMVQVIMPTYSDNDCDSEEGECEEGPLAITKPFISPLKSNKVDRWQDAMGRRLNGKPTKHGTYFKNGIPVTIK